MTLLTSILAACAIVPLPGARLEPTPAPPRPAYIHVWLLPEYGTVWTWGPAVNWEPAIVHAWRPGLPTTLGATAEWGVRCRRCQMANWVCPDSEAVWPIKPGYGSVRAWDAVWLGQVRESKFQDWLRRGAQKRVEEGR